MPSRNSSTTVLLMDSDLGFMFALSQELRQRQIAAFPSRTVTEARSLLQQFRLQPAALVIECSRPKASAFADGVAKEHPGVQIFAVVSERYRCSQGPDRLAAKFRDPEDRTPERIRYVADVIEAVLREQRRPARARQARVKRDAFSYLAGPLSRI